MTVQERPTREDVLASEAMMAMCRWEGWRHELRFKAALSLSRGTVTQEFHDLMEEYLYGMDKGAGEVSDEQEA